MCGMDAVECMESDSVVTRSTDRGRKERGMARKSGCHCVITSLHACGDCSIDAAQFAAGMFAQGGYLFRWRPSPCCRLQLICRNLP